jgi:NAD(P)-dependent dehydrogenase (short-subunit alcohol dehydrogenase family)
MNGYILVTGGTGFMGQHLVQALCQRRYDVRLLVRPSTLEDGTNWKDLAALGAEIVPGDVAERSSLPHAPEDVRAVFHLAGAITKYAAEHQARAALPEARALVATALALFTVFALLAVAPVFARLFQVGPAEQPLVVPLVQLSAIWLGVFILGAAVLAPSSFLALGVLGAAGCALYALAYLAFSVNVEERRLVRLAWQGGRALLSERLRRPARSIPEIGPREDSVG